MEKGHATSHHVNGSDRPSTRTYKEHLLTIQELQEKLELPEIDIQRGLTSEEAAARLKRYGPNELTKQAAISEWLRLLKKFADPFMVLLEIASLLSFILYGIKTENRSNLYVAIVLIAIICLTCTMSYYQEGQAEKLMKTFESMMPTHALV